MSDQIYMDVPAVLSMSQRLTTMGERMDQASDAVGMLITILETTAFIGWIGAKARQVFEGQLKPKMDKVTMCLAELGQDLTDAANAYQRGDATGATRFY